MSELPRRQQRAGLTVDQRVDFLEDDADRGDRRLADALESIQDVAAETRSLLVKLLFAVITLCFTIIGGIAVAVVTR